ncbi:MAG TPA: hypothetical protein ENN50_05780 [Prosthecochloris aestuarii]|uniref:Uncharacterized protein n=1 Tax=Prosthecochloris aestuarii TaxID=1102 RepID=A0A831WUW4_PROAE|nr:hypothetical protein [Prosthecochloris aestuarii]
MKTGNDVMHRLKKMMSAGLRGPEGFVSMLAGFGMLWSGVLAASLALGLEWLALTVFLFSGAIASAVCFFSGTLLRSLGKSRTVWLMLAAITFYLVSMTGLAFPEFLLENGFGAALRLALFFCVLAAGVSFAMAGREGPSHIVALVIAGITLFGCIPGNGLVGGIRYMGWLISSQADHPDNGMGSGIDDVDKAIRQKYLEEYLIKLQEIEREWAEKEISAAEYEKIRRALEARYGDYVNSASAGSGAQGSGEFRVHTAFVSARQGEGDRSGVADRFVQGEHSLYYYLRYTGADSADEAYELRWLHGGKLFRQKPLSLAVGSGELIDSVDRVFDAGTYDVQLFNGEKLLASTRFTVTVPLVARIHSVQAAPAAVFPGDLLNVYTEYSFALNDDIDSVSVREQCVIRRNGVSVAGPVVHDVVREIGMNTAVFRIVLPRQLAAGTYEAETIFYCDGREISSSTVFDVTSPWYGRNDRPVYPRRDRPASSSGTAKVPGEVRLDDLGSILERIYGRE